MEIRHFSAPTYAEALRIVRGNLGDDALILSNQRISKGDDDAGPFEVRMTAVGGSDANQLYAASTPSPASNSQPKNSHSLSVERIDALDALGARLKKEEIADTVIERIIESVKRRASGVKILPDRAVELLILEIMHRTQVLPPTARNASARFTTFVGASGVGKSTLLCKLAVATALKEGRDVGFISVHEDQLVDDQIRKTASILQVPLRAVSDPGTMSTALTDLSGCHHLLIDAPGVGPYYEEPMSWLKSMLAVVPNLERHLLLQTCARDSVNQKIIDAYHDWSLRSLAFSHLDDAVHYGTIFNAIDYADLPLSYFSFGREVPSDLEHASKERVVDLILNITASTDVDHRASSEIQRAS